MAYLLARSDPAPGQARWVARTSDDTHEGRGDTPVDALFALVLRMEADRPKD